MKFMNGPSPKGQTPVVAGSGHHFTGDLLALVVRHKLRIMTVAMLAVLAAGFYNFVHEPRYTASMRVLVSPGAGALSLQPEAAQAATLLVPDHGQAARHLAALLNDPGLVASMVPAPRAVPGFPAARRFPAVLHVAGALARAAGVLDLGRSPVCRRRDGGHCLGRDKGGERGERGPGGFGARAGGVA